MSRKEFGYIFRVLKDFAARERRVVICMWVLSVIGAVRPYIAVVLMGFLLDRVKVGEEPLRLVKYALLALGINMVIRVVESRLREWFNQKNEFIKEIEARTLNDKSLRMDYEYLENIKVQELRFKSLQESHLGVVGYLMWAIEKLVTALVSIVVALVILVPMFADSTNGGSFFTSWYSTVLLFLFMGVMIFLNYRKVIRCAEEHKKISEENYQRYNQMNYYLDLLARPDSQKDLRMYAQQEIVEQEAAELADSLMECNKRRNGILTKLDCMGQSMSDVFGLLVYLFTGMRAYAGVITIGGVVTYASSILQFTRSVATFAKVMGEMKQITLLCKDYCEYMDLVKQKYEGTIPMEKRRDNKFQVEFEHVSFKYPGTDTYVIKDLNLSFVIGEKMAIVGKNGSGKTTFIKLLCRLYDVTEGCIKVNGIDIRKYDYREYCRLFAVVFQDFRMFAFPVGENVAAGSDVDEERAKDALVRAGLGEKLAALEKGLNTYVGKDFADEGVNFSGGEKQKMAIARAIYKDAPFVIMDEPTAALDPEAECEVFEGFDRMVGKKTAIYISHRLASCRFCEDILVFDRGSVVQRGSHEELEGQEGLYRELWHAQAQYYA